MYTQIGLNKAAVKLKSSLLILMMIAPAFIIFTTFVVVPVVQAAYYSLFEWNGLGPLENFRGISNFLKAFEHDIFITALFNNLQIVVLSITLQLPTAFLLALLIGRKRFFGSMIFRGFYFFPYVLAEIVVGIIWKFIYDPEYGIPTAFLHLIENSERQIGLLGSVDHAFYAIFVVIFWKYIGFHMIIYIAGLQGVPKELEEAAVIDGANKFQVVLHVIIPSMKSSLMISFFLCVIGSFNVFDIVWAMGQGGPVHSAETLVTYMYNFGFRRFAFGYGSAVAIVIFLLCLIFNIFYQKYIVAED